MPVGKEGIFVPHENGSPSGQDLAACFYDALRRDVALKTIAAQETEIRVQGFLRRIAHDRKAVSARFPIFQCCVGIEDYVLQRRCLCQSAFDSPVVW